MNLNTSLFEWIFHFAHRNQLLDAFFIFLAQYFPYLLVLGFFVLVASQKGWRRRVFLLIEGVLGILLARGIITELIRFFYHHPRPFEVLSISSLIPESGGSFPSGHAAFFFALATTIFFINRHWGSWYFILSFINGVARVFAGVHWPLDIAGGILVGILSAIIIHQLLKSSFTDLFKVSPHPTTETIPPEP